MKSRTQLLHEIMMYDFALQDAALFLDLNQDNKDALHYYEQHKQLLQMSKQEYEKYYGLLTNRSGYHGNYASYAETAWPWEKAEEENC